MTRTDVAQADMEYVAFLDLYAAEDIAETKADDADAADWNHDPERTVAWSMAFENDNETREKMEADEARYGSFSELLFANL